MQLLLRVSTLMKKSQLMYRHLSFKLTWKYWMVPKQCMTIVFLFTRESFTTLTTCHHHTRKAFSEQMMTLKLKVTKQSISKAPHKDNPNYLWTFSSILTQTSHAQKAMSQSKFFKLRYSASIVNRKCFTCRLMGHNGNNTLANAESLYP